MPDDFEGALEGLRRGWRRQRQLTRREQAGLEGVRDRVENMRELLEIHVARARYRADEARDGRRCQRKRVSGHGRAADQVQQLGREWRRLLGEEPARQRLDRKSTR